ncbi:MAG: hypothetical protein K9I74_08045 [Bacteroidales bacterium]|nr:hypothetical protein [Bacteroidales bacterium]
MTLQEILDRLPSIKENRNYWFVRTNSGDYYKPFIDGGFIAIGWNLITLEDLSQIRADDNTGFKILKEKVRKKYPDEYRPGHAVNQMLKFTYSITKNDIVLIPSMNSEEITFGEVIESPSFNEFNKQYGCDFVKRKKVNWLRSINRNGLDPNLFRLMFSHHTISEADQYAEHIDKEINSFFIKGEKAHIVLGVQAHQDIKAKELFQLGLLPLEIFDEFCNEANLQYRSEDFNVKLDVQSPGFIEISGLAIGGIVILGIILVAIAGGGFDLNYKKDFKIGIKTEGIIEKISKFLKTKSNIRTKKELLEKHMKDLNIKDPQELIDILKELDK